MTIASQTSRISYTGDGATTAFPVPFYFAANADIVVTLQDTLGNQTTEILGTNYNLIGATVSAGGTCIFTVPPTTGYLVVIYRDPPITQTTSYNNNDPFPAKSHELALDKLTTIAQRAKDQVSRALHQTEGEAVMTTALATIATRKNKLLGFDTNGGLIYVTGPTFVNSTFTGTAVFDTRATAAITIIAGSINCIVTLGLAVAGDGGGGTYIKGTVSSAGAFLDGGGTQYWGLINVFGSNNVVNFDTRITAAATKIGASVNIINTYGLSTAGDGGGATYTRGTVSSPGAFLDGGGTQYWGTVSGAGAGLSRGFLSGMTLSNDIALPNTVLDISSGVCRDSTDVTNIKVISGYTKTTGAWVVGTGNGGLDTGSIANNTWYHVHAIIRADTGVTDYLFSLSATSPTLPTNYTNFARIGSFKTAAASTNILAFSQLGDTFLWKVEDGTGTAFMNFNIGVAASLPVPTVPTGVQVEALTRFQITNPVAGTTSFLISSPDQTDQSPSVGSSLAVIGSGSISGAEFRTRTNTSGQIRVRSSTAATPVYATTVGWREL